MAQLTGVHHIAMKVKNFDASVDFYTNTLGLHEDISWGDMGKRAIMLRFADGAYLELFEGGKEGERPENAGVWCHIALRTDDTDALYAKAMACGAKSKMQPTKVDVASKPTQKRINIAFVFGPDGEVIEFFEEMK